MISISVDFSGFIFFVQSSVLVSFEMIEREINTRSLYPIINGIDNKISQSDLDVNTCSRRKARQNLCEQITFGLGFTSDWLRKWRDFLINQSLTVVIQNQSKNLLFFKTPFVEI